MLSRLARLATVGAILVGAHVARAISSTGDSVLVLLEPKLARDDFSLFFNGLEERGFNLTFRAPKDAAPAVSEYGVPQFSHVVLFAPTTKTLAQDLSSPQIVSLLSADPPVNFLIALSPSTSQLSALASEFSLSLPPPNTPLISHFPSRAGPHSIVPITLPAPGSGAGLAPNKRTPPVLRHKNAQASILFEGVPFYTNSNPQLFSILHTPAESFASDANSGEGAKDSAGAASAVVESAEKGGEGLWAGESMSVVAGFVVKGSGARVLWAGGVSLFSDEFGNAQVPVSAAPGSAVAAGVVPSGNAQFAKDVSDWVFQSSLVVRIASATHYVAGDESKTQRDVYTVGTQVTFDVHVQSWNAIRGEWTDDAPTPTGTPLEDLQLEFTMLDPHVRTAIIPVAGKKGWYSISFRAPDRHGVFKFVIDWRRKGFTNLFYSNTVSVVPKRHDEYPRFISAAWPYYAGALSTSVGFLVFSIVYLGGEVDRKSKGKSKSVKNE